jgi:hypothetical protein
MAVTLEILDAEVGLVAHQNAVRRAEERGFTLLSFGAGRVEGTRGNLVLFDQTPAPATPITLRIVAGGLDANEQEEELNEIGAPIVAYGSLYVGGKLTNVVAHR